MKKFFKLVAVVLAIAVIICPMTIFAETSTSSGTYKIELVDANTVQLTINSTDGFVAYHAIVGFNRDDAFQSSYNDDGYVDGLKVISYTLKTEQANDHNTPTIRAHASGTSLNVIVMPSDTNNLDLCTKIVIGIRVASGATASLTKIQAADNGTVDSDNANLLTFPAAGSDGVIDTNANDYDAANAVAAHVHTVVEDAAVAPTCTETGLTAGSHCSVCNEVLVAQTVVPATGHSFTNYVSNNDATCTQDGTKTAYCDHECGTTKTIADEGSALGHNMTHHDAVSSTCLVQGNIEYYSCSRCNKLFANESGATELTEEETKIALAAHTPSEAVVENDVASTCTTAGHYQNVVYCSVCGVELSRDTYNRELKAHTYGEWTIDADGHSRTCSVCGTVESGTHDGNPCSVCGYEAAEVCQHVHLEFVSATPTHDAETTGTIRLHCLDCDETFDQDLIYQSTLRFRYPALELKSEIIYALQGRQSEVGGYDAGFVVSTQTHTFTDVPTVTINDLIADRAVGVKQSTYDTWRFDVKIASTTMSDTIVTEIYALKDGVWYCGRQNTNSVKSFIESNFAGQNNKMKTLFVDLLNYGAAAQTYFGKAIDNLPNKDLTPAQLECASTTVDPAVSIKEGGTREAGVLAKSVGVSQHGLTLSSKIPLDYTLHTTNYANLGKEISDLTAIVTYTDNYGADHEVQYKLEGYEGPGQETMVYTKANRYTFTFTDFSASHIRTEFTLNVVCSEGQVLETYTYSVASFIADNPTSDPNLQALYTALLKYGDACRAAFVS